eukprot:464349-Amphidinium_carterae.6
MRWAKFCKDCCGSHGQHRGKNVQKMTDFFGRPLRVCSAWKASSAGVVEASCAGNGMRVAQGCEPQTTKFGWKGGDSPLQGGERCLLCELSESAGLGTIDAFKMWRQSHQRVSTHQVHELCSCIAAKRLERNLRSGSRTRKQQRKLAALI